MKFLRAAATTALVLALAFAAGRAGPSSTEKEWSTACTPNALAKAFGGQFALRSIESFGCAEGWAFAWATVGVGPQEIGVTEVLRFNSSTTGWSFVSRLQWCKPGRLPDLVYRQGCFSN